MVEKGIENKFIKECKKKGWWVVKVGILGEDGMPDRMLILPGGLVAWVELKAPGEKPRKLQVYQHKKLRNVGHKVYVVSCKEAISGAIKQIKEYVNGI